MEITEKKYGNNIMNKLQMTKNFRNNFISQVGKYKHMI